MMPLQRKERKEVLEEFFAALDQAFLIYRQDLTKFENSRRPTDGLFGLGRTLQNDPCHDRFDESIEQAVQAMCASSPGSIDAEKAIRMLFIWHQPQDWPLAAQWMLRAIERHALPLIPFLNSEAAAALQKEYAKHYKPWDRLPAQKEVYNALKAQASHKQIAQ